ncbi:unnamed protein product, partial [Polarella glacialis]
FETASALLRSEYAVRAEQIKSQREAAVSGLRAEHAERREEAVAEANREHAATVEQQELGFKAERRQLEEQVEQENAVLAEARAKAANAKEECAEHQHQLDEMSRELQERKRQGQVLIQESDKACYRKLRAEAEARELRRRKVAMERTLGSPSAAANNGGAAPEAAERAVVTVSEDLRTAQARLEALRNELGQKQRMLQGFGNMRWLGPSRCEHTSAWSATLSAWSPHERTPPPSVLFSFANERSASNCDETLRFFEWRQELQEERRRSAKALLNELRESDVAYILKELENKKDSVRNASSFAVGLVKRFKPRSEQDAVGHAEYGDRERYRSRSPRGARGEPPLEPARASAQPSEESDDELQRQQVQDFVMSCALLDDGAKKALCEVRPLQALEIMQTIAAKGNEIRNHSAFVMRACNDHHGRRGQGKGGGGGSWGAPSDAQHGFVQEAEEEWKDGRESQYDEAAVGFKSEAAPDPAPVSGLRASFSKFLGGAAGSNREVLVPGGLRAQVKAKAAPPPLAAPSPAAPSAARQPAAPSAARQPEVSAVTGDWRSMDLGSWLRSVDSGKGFLLQYEAALTSNYDTLEQVVDVYVKPPGQDGRVNIDKMFFDDIGVEKVGHRRLFEKWFKDHM